MARLKISEVEVRAARVLLGMKGHRPSGFNACVGGRLKGSTYAKPPVGTGGRHNIEVRRAFVQAAIACGANVSASARARYG